MAVKQELQHAVDADFHPTPLTLRPYRSAKTGAGANYVFPASITYSDKGALYVSDNNGHRIHYWAIDSPTLTALPAESGNGQLKFPNTIQYSAGNILISDNDGIKVVSPDGRFQRLIRSYLGVFSFVEDQQSIFINPLVRNPKAEDPLIIELDKKGKQVSGFGRRRDVVAYKGLADQAYLSASANLLFVAFKHQPLVEIYDTSSGELRGSFEIDHPVFRSLTSELARKGIGHKQEQERIFLPRYLSGVRIIDDRVFICLSLPDPEIWEFDKKGTTVGKYKVSGLPTAVDIFGFDIRLSQESLVFSIGIIDQEWNATVSELKAIPSA